MRGAVADVVGCHDMHRVGDGGQAVYGVGPAGVAGDRQFETHTTHTNLGSIATHGTTEVDLQVGNLLATDNTAESTKA